MDAVHQSPNATPTPEASTLNQERPSSEKKVIKLIPNVCAFFRVNTTLPDAPIRKVRFGRINDDSKQICATIYILCANEKWTLIEHVTGEKIKISGPLTPGSEFERTTPLSDFDKDTQDQILNNLRPAEDGTPAESDQDLKSKWSVLPKTKLRLTLDKTTGKKKAQYVTPEILLMRQYA